MVHETRDIPVEVVTRMRAEWMPRVIPADATTTAERRAHIDEIYRRAWTSEVGAVFEVGSPLDAARVAGLVADCLREGDRLPNAIPALTVALVADGHRHGLSERLVTEVADWVLTAPKRADEPLPIASRFRTDERRWMPFDRREGPTALWWAHRGFAITCPAAVALHHDDDGQLHAEEGPAMAWANGDVVYAWRGTLVPRDLVEGENPVARIFAERNLEVRRCAIEMMTWPRFLESGRLARVGEPVPDPANPGHQLTLHYLTPHVIGFSAHILLCTNASPERDGTRRRYAIFTPDSIADPLAAAAWTFGLTRHQYAQLGAAS